MSANPALVKHVRDAVGAELARTPAGAVHETIILFPLTAGSVRDMNRGGEERTPVRRLCWYGRRPSNSPHAIEPPAARRLIPILPKPPFPKRYFPIRCEMVA